jgi:hypothetical protein
VQAESLDAPILNTIWLGYFNTGLFGFTYDFVTVACFNMGPEQVCQEKKENSRFVSVIIMNLDTVIGGLLALTLVNLGSSS